MKRIIGRSIAGCECGESTLKCGRPKKFSTLSFIDNPPLPSRIPLPHCSFPPPSYEMAPSRTSTVKSKHATNKSGIKNSKTSTKPRGDGVSKARSAKSKKTQSKGVSLKQTKSAGGALAALKKKRRVYTEKELGIPQLNMITPVGVEKPKGKKKGKVFVDDRVSPSIAFNRVFAIWIGECVLIIK